MLGSEQIERDRYGDGSEKEERRTKRAEMRMRPQCMLYATVVCQRRDFALTGVRMSLSDSACARNCAVDSLALTSVLGKNS